MKEILKTLIKRTNNHLNILGSIDNEELSRYGGQEIGYYTARKTTLENVIDDLIDLENENNSTK